MPKLSTPAKELAAKLRTALKQIALTPPSDAKVPEDKQKFKEVTYFRKNVSVGVKDLGQALHVFVFLGDTAPCRAYCADCLPRVTKLVRDVCSKHGWYTSTSSHVPGQKKSGTYFYLLPLRTAQVDLSGVEYIYHVTPTTNVKGILKTGLVPSKEGRRGRDQREGFTYFAKTEKGSRIALEMLCLSEPLKSPLSKKANWTTLRIKVAKIPASATFHLDPEAPKPAGEFFYTKFKIPASAISVQGSKTASLLLQITRLAKALTTYKDK